MADIQWQSQQSSESIKNGEQSLEKRRRHEKKVEEIWTAIGQGLNEMNEVTNVSRNAMCKSKKTRQLSYVRMLYK